MHHNLLLFLYIWGFGLLCSFELLSRTLTGHSLFSSAVKSSEINLPYNLHVGFTGPKIYSIIAFFIYGTLPIVVLLGPEMIGDEWYLGVFFAGFLIFSLIGVLITVRAQLIVFNRDSIIVTPVASATGYPLQHKMQNFSLNDFTKVTLFLPTQKVPPGGRGTIMLGIGNDSDPSKIEFLPPPQFLADSFTYQLGKALNLSTYIDNGFSIKEINNK